MEKTKGGRRPSCQPNLDLERNYRRYVQRLFPHYRGPVPVPWVPAPADK